MKLVKSYNKIFKIDGFEKGRDLLIIAGPCSIENEEQIFEVASQLERMGIRFMRSAVYKPRTSPYSFQGLGEIGFEIIKKIKDKFKINIVSELTNLDSLHLYEKYVDIIQIGARNMQNFELLRGVSKSEKPVLLKRGFGNTIEEWLNAAEYIMLGGNDQVILCERGIKTFEPSTRNTLDISSVGIVKGLTKLPIIVDPSHASGRSDLVYSLSLASIAAGSDGLMIEVHPNPKESISDEKQALGFDEFEKTIRKSRFLYENIYLK